MPAGFVSVQSGARASARVCPAGVRFRRRWHGVQGRLSSARRIFSRRAVGSLPRTTMGGELCRRWA